MIFTPLNSKQFAQDCGYIGREIRVARELIRIAAAHETRLGVTVRGSTTELFYDRRTGLSSTFNWTTCILRRLLVNTSGI